MKSKLNKLLITCNFDIIGNYLLLIYAFCISLPGTNNIFKKYSLLSVFLISLVLIIKNNTWKTFKINSKNLILVLLPIYCLLAFLYFPVEVDEKMFWWVEQRRLFLLIGPSILLFGGVLKVNLSEMLNALIIGVMFSICSVLFLMFNKNGLLGFDNFFENFNCIRARYYSHHVPFNILLNFSSSGIIFMLFKFNDIGVFKKCLYVIALIIISCLLLNTEGRSGLLGFIVMVSSVTFFYIYKWKRMFSIILFVVILISGFLVVKNHPRFSNIEENNISTIEKVGRLPRLFIWGQSISLIKERPFWGYGVGNAQVELNKRYEKYNYTTGVKEQHYHTHNQVLQTWLEFGAWGLVLVLIILIFPLYFYYFHNRNELILFWWLILIIANMTEPLLKESMGMFSFLLLLYVMFCDFHELEIPEVSKNLPVI